ncbi:MAG TPA: M48 family metalloprotease [Candidatus Dormibacteraeota bacterium]|nr:M48 family metalloprotease [Candidatus Dormibacteraeota bacterium]
MHLRTVAGALAALAVLASTAAAISYEGERGLGQQFDLTVRQRAPLVDDPEVVAYVNGVGKRIAATLDQSYFDYQFAVIRDPRINAFAVPGGYVYVHSGLLAALRSDDELAAVLGHEIGHVHAHHIVRQQEKSQVLNYTALLGMLLSVVQPAVGSLATAASQAAALQYTREFEQEADYLGARYMQAAGYDPRAMLDFFKLLGDQQRVSPASAPPYLQTHPMSDERLDRLEAVLKTNQWAARQLPPASMTLQRVQALVRAAGEPPADVLTAYRRMRDADPANPNAQYLYGIVALETGQLDDASTALAAAEAGHVEGVDRELGRLALRRRDLPEARKRLSDYLARKPDDAGAQVDLAQACEALGDSACAESAYQRALATAPWLEAAQHGYGQLAGRSGRAGDGFYHLATAARLNGDYPTALNQYARAVAQLPNGDARREEAQRWVEVLSGYLKVPTPSEGTKDEG